jgi:glycosidase
MRRSVVVLVLATALTGCSGSGVDTTTAAPTTSAPTPTEATTTTAAEPVSRLPWWNDRVFYEVFVRSFKDSDADGIGDFAGLTASLDYLNDGDPTTSDDLGVTGIWLMPIFPSPSYHGYDVTDYRTVNPDYGTMEEFAAFLDAAHERDIAVLIDLVINHSSREHPWFVAAAAEDPEYADWYLWSDTDPGTASPWSGGPLWHPLDDRYYYALFWEGMPDLNLENPATKAEVYDIARFWLEDVGVDGFRLDGARHLIEAGDVVSDTPATVAWLEEFNEYVHSVSPDALVLGEVWSPTTTVARYIPEALDLAFEFDLAAAGGSVVRDEDFAALDSAAATARASYPPLQYATFLTNHDMNRIMSEVGGNVALAKLAATWLLTSPGVPFIYYGEEVGLEGVKPDETIRTPMPWTAEEPGVGFTTGTPWQAPFQGFATANVATQTDDPASLLSHYRALIQDRAASVALRRGATIDVDTGSPSLTAYLRSEGSDHVLIVLNAGDDYATDVSLQLPTGPLAGMQGVVPVVGPEATAPQINAAGGFTDYAPTASIEPRGFLVLRFTAEPSPPPPATTTTTAVTTTTIPATDADVAVIEELYELFVTGDDERIPAVFADDAVWVDPSGAAVPLNTPLPPDAGFDTSWDWDGDGTVTVADIVLAQNAFGVLILTSFEADCMPAGNRVTCAITQTDVFGDRAGIAPPVISQSFRVVDGLVVEMADQETANSSPEDEQAWLDQFADYEQWLATNHPDVYTRAFRDPCCTGTPEGLLFTSDAFDAQRDLVFEWAEGS